jgi:alpha-D-xyloside xylohydrolase
MAPTQVSRSFTIQCEDKTLLSHPFALLVLMFWLISPALAQWAPLNPVTRIQQQSDGVVLTMKSGVLKVQICSDSVVHVLYSLTISFPSRFDPVITKTIGPRQMDNAGERRRGHSLTSRMKVIVTRKDGAITYRDLAGGQLVQEATRKLSPAKVNGEDTYRAESFVNVYGSREALYGLGQHQGGIWNYRGESVDISQDNTNIAVPFLVSSNGYGIFWNNASRSRFNNRFANYLYISSEVADIIDYYFFYGPDLDRVIASYRELTGQAPMFGKWAYGFWQCKNRYKSQEEILGVARKYRELHIPVDNIVQDWFWWNRKVSSYSIRTIPTPKGWWMNCTARTFT